MFLTGVMYVILSHKVLLSEGVHTPYSKDAYTHYLNNYQSLQEKYLFLFLVIATEKE